MARIYRACAPAGGRGGGGDSLPESSRWWGRLTNGFLVTFHRALYKLRQGIASSMQPQPPVLWPWPISICARALKGSRGFLSRPRGITYIHTRAHTYTHIYIYIFDGNFIYEPVPRDLHSSRAALTRPYRPPIIVSHSWIVSVPSTFLVADLLLSAWIVSYGMDSRGRG